MKLSFKAQASGEVVQSSGKGKLFTTENMEENSASAGLKDSGELRKCFQDSLPLNYLNFRSQSTAVIHKFCQGYTSNLLCSSSITVLLSCHYIAQCFTFYFYCIQINH